MGLFKAAAFIVLLFAVGPWIADFTLFSVSGIETIPREWRSTALQLTYTSVTAVFIASMINEWVESMGSRDLQKQPAPDSPPRGEAAAQRQRHRPLGISLRELPAPSDRSLD